MSAMLLSHFYVYLYRRKKCITFAVETKETTMPKKEKLQTLRRKVSFDIELYCTEPVPDDTLMGYIMYSVLNVIPFKEDTPSIVSHSFCNIELNSIE